MKNTFLSYLVEFLGTFTFLVVIIVTGNPIAIGLTLSALIWFASLNNVKTPIHSWSRAVSSGHFNPAVNLMMLFDKKINITEFILQTLSQIIAVICAYLYYKQIHINK